jgi:pyridoxamine 5'-phosphate oxidase family protein
MPVFTDIEIEYLRTQPLGRLATAQPNGTLQVSPVGFHYNPVTETIDIAGHGMAASKKYRNVTANRQAAFVVDDLATTNPWRPRFIEIRGWGETIDEPTDSAYPAGHSFARAIIRIHPQRILTLGLAPLEPGQSPMTITARDADPMQPKETSR